MEVVFANRQCDICDWSRQGRLTIAHRLTEGRDSSEPESPGRDERCRQATSIEHKSSDESIVRGLMIHVDHAAPIFFRPCRDSHSCLHPNPPLKRWAIVECPWRDKRTIPSCDNFLQLTPTIQRLTVCRITRANSSNPSELAASTSCCTTRTSGHPEPPIAPAIRRLQH